MSRLSDREIAQVNIALSRAFTDSHTTLFYIRSNAEYRAVIDSETAFKYALYLLKRVRRECIKDLKTFIKIGNDTIGLLESIEDIDYAIDFFEIELDLVFQMQHEYNMYRCSHFGLNFLKLFFGWTRPDEDLYSFDVLTMTEEEEHQDE